MQAMHQPLQGVNGSLILRPGARMTIAIGVVVGLAAVLAGTRVLAEELQGVHPTSAGSFRATHADCASENWHSTDLGGALE